jgi:hypothetical protein
MCASARCNDCGIILSETIKVKNRNVCKYCRKRQHREYYKNNKNIISEKKKNKRKKLKTKKLCLVCQIEFETARDYQVTCAGKHCTMIYQRVKKRLYDIEKRKKKNVKRSIKTNKR